MSRPLTLVDDRRESTEDFCGMVGEHPTMLGLFDAIRRAAPLEAPVLIEGPTGAGKELVARALHRLSGRTGPMVDLNVAALPESLAEAELFGVVRGAYTGATERPGLLEQADGGTLLLDEAADMAPWLQAKLLRALEAHAVRRVGGRSDRTTRFRLVVTTQRPAAELVAAGRWRADFYYRVSGIALRVPPLAARPADIPLLANRFLAELGHPPMPPAEAAGLASYSWPGNVRELRYALQRAAFAVMPRAVTALDVLACLEGPPPAREASVRVKEAARAAARASEARRLEAVLRELGFDTAAAAQRLGISRSHLYRKIHRLGLTLPGARSGARRRFPPPARPTLGEVEPFSSGFSREENPST